MELEQLVLEDAGDAELVHPLAGLVREVVGHLEVNVVGRNEFLASPALLDDADQFVADVDTELVLPTLLEPIL